MAGFRLKLFPKVCHICLKYQPETLFISLDTIEHIHGMPLVEVLYELMYPISPELQHLTPRGICELCYKQLDEFLAYRNRLKLIGKFVYSLALLQNGQPDHLEELMCEHQTELLMVLRELKITDKHELVVQELMEVFDQHYFVSESEQKSMVDDACISDHLMLKESEELVKLNQLQNQVHEQLEIRECVAVQTNGTMKEFGNDSEDTECQFKPNFEQIDMISLELDDEETITRNSSLRSSRKKRAICQCQQCSFTTFCSKAFQQHKKTHQKKKRNGYSCKRCNHEFDTKRDLLQHKRSTHRDHMCDTCGLAFDTKFVLENHRKRHETVRQYKCEYCPLEYYTKAEKLLHVRRIHLNVFEVSCPECALMFRTKQTLAQHMKTHTNQRTHTCNTCGFSFKSHTHLNRHTKELHQGVQYQCEHCDMTYRRKDKLRMHVEKMHNIQTYFVCDICLQSYDTDEKLQEHKAHHQHPNDLQCGVCLGAYVAKEELDNHLCITYRENYICCNRDFKFHYFYNKHMFLMHGEQTNVRVKPVGGVLLGQYRAKRKQAERCPKCAQEFATRQQKKAHMKSCGVVQQYDSTTHR